MTKRNILSVLFASLLVGSCSGPEVRLEKIAPYAVPQIPLEEETLTDLPDLFAPPLHLLNDTLLCLLNQQDASSIRIFQTTGKEMNQYTLKKKDTAIVISPDENLQARLEYLNPANNVYYELAVDRGEMSIADFTRLRLGKFSPKEAFKVGDKLFVGLGPLPQRTTQCFRQRQAKQRNQLLRKLSRCRDGISIPGIPRLFPGTPGPTRQPVHIRQHLFRLYRFLFLRKTNA